MSRENVELVSNLISAGAGMDKQAILEALPHVVAEVFAPDVEWIEDPGRVDAGHYRGHDGVLESWTRWLEQWDDDYSAEVERIEDRGDQVLVVIRERMRGAASGVPVDARTYSLWTIREGKVARYREFLDEESALAAAGRTMGP